MVAKYAIAHNANHVLNAHVRLYTEIRPSII